LTPQPSEKIDIALDTSIRAVIPVELDAKLVMAGLPGAQIARDGSSYMDPERCQLCFQALNQMNTQAIYLLMEAHELPPQAIPVIEACAKATGVEVIWISIRDFDIPGAEFEAKWRASKPYRMAALAAGKGLCLACLYGAGRSGMMTAAVLCETGREGQEAIAYVREIYGEAIGNVKQEDWVKGATYLD